MSGGADGTADVATHVAVEIDRAWCDDVTAALADVAAGDEGKLAVVMARWWQRREARLDVATTALGDALRAELTAALAGEDLFADLAATAPAMVRTGALIALRRAAPRLRRLAETGAPGVILDGQRVSVARLLGDLDPASKREHEPTPEVGVTVDAAGNEVVDLHAWLDSMLAAAVVDEPSVGIGDAFGARPEAVAFLAKSRAAVDASRDGTPRASTLPEVRVWPGLATLTVHPDLTFWASPAIALPHRIEVPTTPPKLVAAESSGPITYAVAGDVPGDGLLPELATRVTGLGRDRALLSFVWLTTDTAGPWRPIG